MILTFLGIAGLILGAVNFMNGGSNTRNVKEIVIYFALGAIFFLRGSVLSERQETSLPDEKNIEDF